MRSNNSPDPRNGPLGPLWRRLEGEYRAGTKWWERWLAGWVGRRVLRRNRAKLDDVIKRGSERLAEFAESAIRGVMARFYGRFDLVIARSEIYRRRLIDEMGLLPDRVKTLRAGVDTRLFSPLPGGADDYLHLRLAVPERAKIVLYVGRVTDEKNVGFLADAWRAFRERAGRSEPDAVFVVAGGGNLDEFSRRAGPGVLTLGPCGGETLSALYRRADLFWTASTTETLGQVVLEAQSSGLPVLVSRSRRGLRKRGRWRDRVRPAGRFTRALGRSISATARGRRPANDDGRRGPKAGRGPDDRGLVPALLGTAPGARRIAMWRRSCRSSPNRVITKLPPPATRTTWKLIGWPGLSFAPRSPGKGRRPQPRAVPPPSI